MHRIILKFSCVFVRDCLTKYLPCRFSRTNRGFTVYCTILSTDRASLGCYSHFTTLGMWIEFSWGQTIPRQGRPRTEPLYTTVCMESFRIQGCSRTGWGQDWPWIEATNAVCMEDQLDFTTLYVKQCWFSTMFPQWYATNLLIENNCFWYFLMIWGGRYFK